MLKVYVTTKKSLLNLFWITRNLLHVTDPDRRTQLAIPASFFYVCINLFSVVKVCMVRSETILNVLSLSVAEFTRIRISTETEILS